MPNPNDFKHLSLPIHLTGKPKLRGMQPSTERTLQNRENRVTHGQELFNRGSELSRFWKDRHRTGGNEVLSRIQSGIPILVEIDENADIDFLRGLGFEIVSEVEDGYVIVSSDDIELGVFNRKVNEFIKNAHQKCNSPAKIYALCQESERIKNILVGELIEVWPTLTDDQQVEVDISISCCGTVNLPNKPKPEEGESQEKYTKKLIKWERRFSEAYLAWDEIKQAREDTLQGFVEAYDGEIFSTIDGLPAFTDLPDSFSSRLCISGRGLRDLIMNFPYVFEASLSQEIKIDHLTSRLTSPEDHITVLPPDDDAPIVCVIDSGIQEGHQYISQAMRSQDSISLVPGNLSTNDEVDGGGHGTRVAGAILYPLEIKKHSEYTLPCFLRNIRALDNNNCLPVRLIPSKVVTQVVEKFINTDESPSKIINHSIGSSAPCRITHMSTWAAIIDLLSYEFDFLFIQAAGNISDQTISNFYRSGSPYPDYLDQSSSRICNPAQSLQSLTIGSVAVSDFETDDRICLGKKGEVSSFSRSGPGIWDSIKPEVVEYGGTHSINKEGEPKVLTTPSEVCVELARTSPPGPAFAKDGIGTSFSTPKITSIAAKIQSILPAAPALLYRALIAQSAHWPDYANSYNDWEKQKLLRRLGYGMPDLNRATTNNEYRVTYITNELYEVGEGEAHLFRIPIPEEINSVGDDYNILLEITLSYAAKPRRTRRYIRGYLSTWLDWCCSKIGEDLEAFQQRIFITGRGEGVSDFKWAIGDKINHGMVEGFSRTKETLQKDWCIIKSNQLSDSFCIAVRGHKGWGDLFRAKYSLAVSFEAIDQDIPIYESLRSTLQTMVEVENSEIEIEY